MTTDASDEPVRRLIDQIDAARFPSEVIRILVADGHQLAPLYGDDGAMVRHLYYRGGMTRDDLNAMVAALERANKRMPLCEYVHATDLRASRKALDDLRSRLDGRRKTSLQAIERAEHQHSLLNRLRGLSVRQFISGANLAGRQITPTFTEDGHRSATIATSGGDARIWWAVWLALPGDDLIRAAHRMHRAEALRADVAQRSKHYACIWRDDIPRIATLGQMQTLLAVAALAGGTDSAHASRADLTHITGMDRAVITRALGELATIGVVSTARGVVTYLRHHSRRLDGDFYSAVPMAVVMGARLSLGEWRVFLAMLSSVGRGGRSRVSVGLATMAKRAGVSRPTAERAVLRLGKWGLLRCESGRGFGSTNEYDLTPTSDKWTAPADMLKVSEYDASVRKWRAKEARAAVSFTKSGDSDDVPNQKSGDSDDVPVVTPVMDGGDSDDVPVVTPVMDEDSPLGITMRNHHKERSLAARAYPAACGYGDHASPAGHGSWLESIGLRMALAEIATPAIKTGRTLH